MNIETINFKPSEDLVSKIKLKLDKLLQHYPFIIHHQFFLKLDAQLTSENQIIELRLDVPGDQIYASAADNKFEHGLNKLIDKAIKQLEKYKKVHYKSNQGRD